MRDRDGQPVCARCSDRPQRQCGSCGQVRRVGRRAGPGGPDICVNCYRLPTDVCIRCGRRRPCNQAGTPQATCKTCTPRRATTVRPLRAAAPADSAQGRGPDLRPLLHESAAPARALRPVRHRTPPRPPTRPGCTTCADCAGLPAGLRCRDCGRRDKLYERGRCPACSLRRRSHDLLRAGAPRVSEHLTAVHEAICASPVPRSVLNWLRNSATAALLADLDSRAARPFARGTRRPPEHRSRRPPTAPARHPPPAARPRRGPGPDPTAYRRRRRRHPPGRAPSHRPRLRHLACPAPTAPPSRARAAATLWNVRQSPRAGVTQCPTGSVVEG